MWQAQKSAGTPPPELLDGTNLKIGLVVARFNHVFTTRMLRICRARLTELGATVDDRHVVFAPGSYDLPIVARVLIERNPSLDAVIALGSVIRGETAHFDHVAYGASQGLLRVADDTRTPIVFGVLTTDTVTQSEERVPHAKTYAENAIELANVVARLNRPRGSIGIR